MIGAYWGQTVEKSGTAVSKNMLNGMAAGGGMPRKLYTSTPQIKLSLATVHTVATIAMVPLPRST